jgi:transcriptional regulator with PAS, ATPase and Fis domain
MIQPAGDTTYVFLGATAVIASESMRRLLEVVERVARSNVNVLIIGESGSGKEMIARAVHDFSTRSEKPWVDLSCAALPEHLLESELFGYEKGAFTGAESFKPGLFELANRGTIFLDEIGELDPRMQVKLLRVLDGVPYYRLGGVKKVTTDVRVVAATNQNLERAVAEGRFRGDLYHRLSQFVLMVPPLRHRPEDTTALAWHFLAQQDPRLSFSPAAMALLESHTWPGNIRELRNTVIQASVMVTGPVVQASDIQIRPMTVVHPAPEPLPVASAATPYPNGEPAVNLDHMERRMIYEALRSSGGHQQRAAEKLGISRRTLSRKLKLYESQQVEAAI